MSAYQHILVALDTSEQAPQVLEKAHKLAQQNSATLSVLHVIEPMADAANYAFDGTIAVNLLPLQNTLEEATRENIKKLVNPFAIPEQHQYILIGQAASQIHDFSEQHGCDLIVIGSHGRHGLALLLGSTANAVLHGAKCDVLAVRFKD